MMKKTMGLGLIALMSMSSAIAGGHTGTGGEGHAGKEGHEQHEGKHDHAKKERKEHKEQYKKMFESDEAFLKHKPKMLQYMDKKIEIIQEKRACFDAAQTAEAAKVCKGDGKKKK